MFYQFSHLASTNYLKIERGENFSFPAHLHQCFEVIVVLSGKMQITVNNRVYNLNKSEGLLVFPNQIHALKSEESEHILCIFSPNLVKEYSTRTIGKVPQDNFFVPQLYLVDALCNLTPEHTITQKKGALYSLCGEFDTNRAYSTYLSDNDKLLDKIFAFVDENFTSDCSLKRLSKMIGYDYAYLSRCFHKIVGLPYKAYVNHCRLSYACYLLENTDYTIIQCALESGYESLRSFNRNFKIHFNMTPSEYKIAHCQN